MRNLVRLILWLILPILLFGQEDIAITVTNSNLGLIREIRQINLQKGINTFHLEDIPEQIDPTSVLVESPGNAFSVLEQNYEYDLINVSKVLEKNIGQEIMITHPDQGTILGRLLSSSSNNIMLLDGDDNMQIVPRNKEQRVILREYSKKEESFILKPTLVWLMNGNKKGNEKAHLSYLTRGLDWHADYVGRLNEDDSELNLACWVSLENNSGKSYQNAKLKLMAGDLNILQQKQPRVRREMMQVMAADAAPAFGEKAFFEYHLYTLQRRTDIGNNQVKQIQLFPEVEAKIEKSYRVSSDNPQKVEVLVRFENNKSNNLGIPLPAGKIRLYKSDGQELEFVGENRIKHTPQNEKLDITVGSAFDIVAERNQTRTSRPSERSRQNSIEYKIRNHKDTSILVEVVERLNQYQETKILKSNIKVHEKKANQVTFLVPVKAGGENTLSFDYITSW